MHKYMIETVDGKKEVKGVKVGNYFAIAPNLGRGGGIAASYSITHLPTGRAVCDFAIAQTAIEFCKALSNNWDWNFTVPSFSISTKSKIEAVFDDFLEKDYQEACKRFDWDDEEGWDFYLEDYAMSLRNAA
jgi:hypothetical protein